MHAFNDHANFGNIKNLWMHIFAILWNQQLEENKVLCWNIIVSYILPWQNEAQEAQECQSDTDVQECDAATSARSGLTCSSWKQSEGATLIWMMERGKKHFIHNKYKFLKSMSPVVIRLRDWKDWRHCRSDPLECSLEQRVWISLVLKLLHRWVNRRPSLSDGFIPLASFVSMAEPSRTTAKEMTLSTTDDGASLPSASSPPKVESRAN